MPDNDVNKVKKLLRSKKQLHTPDFSKGLSTGGTLLNLACSGRPDVGFLPGTMNLLVGDSGSGKTWLVMTMLAEAAHNPVFDKYRLIYHSAENGAMMDVAKFFGTKLTTRLEPPKGTVAKPSHPTILEEAHDAIADAVSAGPCVYMLDSMDPLKPRAWMRKLKQDRKAVENDEDVSGSYGTDKARINSDRLRILTGESGPLAKSGSILVILSQTRDSIGFGARFNPKTRGGGHAMKFYATLEWWMSVKGRITVPIRGHKVPQGIVVKIKVEKNRQQGGEGMVVTVPILRTHGIDDLGGMVDWLIEWKHWKGQFGSDGKGVITTKVISEEFHFDGSREGLIRKIEDQEGGPEKLREIVVGVWNEIESGCSVQRKKRYV